MLVTHTELIDLLRKIFEGLSYGLGEDDDCALAVAWLAMRGRPILQQLADEPATFAPAERVFVLEESAERIVLDGSAGNVMGVAADLIRFKLQSADAITTIIEQTPIPQLIIPYLAQFGGQAEWSRQGVVHNVDTTGWTSRNTEKSQPLTIKCTTNDLPFTLFSNQYDAHLETGLSVDNAVWESLKTLAQAILVPESDYSRQHGAG